MQSTSTTDFSRSSVRLVPPPNVDGDPWLKSSELQVPQSSLSNAVNLEEESPLKHSYKELQDQESSSTQSTGQSHLELPTMEGGNPHNQFCMVNSNVKGSDEAYAKRGDVHMKSVLSRGAQDFIFPTSHVDYNQTACIQYPYPDPYYSGLVAPCGPRATIYPSMLAFARIPLPVDPAEDEPIFVNPKQYRGILRRRESRAKLEAQNKLIKARKPYLHESRHIHAMKRVRGTGGRFLNTKKQGQPGEHSSNDSHHKSEKPLLNMGGNHLDSAVFQHGNSDAGAYGVSCSETTCVSCDDDDDSKTRQMSDLKFSRHPAHTNGTLLGERYNMCNGSQYRVRGIR